jgi:hypothetical protein
MNPLRVRIADALADQRAVLATLPNRFRVTDERGDVVVMAPDAIDSATEGAVMLADPGLASASALRALVQSGCAIGLALAAAPALPEAALAQMRAQDDDLSMIVDAAAETTGTLRSALFELLMLLDTLGCRVEALHLLADTRDQITLGATGPGPWQGVRVSARRSFRTRYSVESVSRTLRREVVVEDVAVATPADVGLFDAKGTHVALPRYEGGLRASWRALHARLAAGAGDDGQIETAIRLLGLLDAAGVTG